MTVREYTVKPKISDQEIAKLEGTYFDENDFDLIINPLFRLLHLFLEFY